MSRCWYCWEQEILPFTVLAFLCCQNHNWIFRLSVTCLFASEPCSRYYIDCAGPGSYIHWCRVSMHLLCGSSHSFFPFTCHLLQSCQMKFPQQKIAEYSPVWAILRLHQGCLWDFGSPGSWWDQWTSLCLVRGCITGLSPALADPDENLQPPGNHCSLGHPAQWTVQNTEASKLVQPQFRCHDMVVMSCIGFG